MAWGFDNDSNGDRDFLNKVLEAHPGAFDLPGTGDSMTPLWMSSLNRLYEGRKAPHELDAAAPYRDRVLDKDTDLSTYEADKEFEADAEQQKRLERMISEKKEHERLKKEMDSYADYVYGKMLEKFQTDNHFNDDDMAVLKADDHSYVNEELRQKARKKALHTPMQWSFLSDISDEDWSPSLDKEYRLHKEWRNYKDELDRKRGIKYPELRYDNGELLEDYMVDDYGKPLDKDDAFTNNVAWFKDRYDIPDDMEYKLRRILNQNRSDLSTKNIVKALRPDSEGGIF